MRWLLLTKNRSIIVPEDWVILVELIISCFKLCKSAKLNNIGRAISKHSISKASLDKSTRCLKGIPSLT